MLTKTNVKKYYPETSKTPKGHLNQTRKNVRSTKTPITNNGCHKPVLAQKRGTRGTSASAAPYKFETPNTMQLRGKKVRDVYTKVYNVRETIFSDQTGQFPKRLLRGNKYIMVLVEIDSNAILVVPMKSQHNNEMKRAYKSMVNRLH